MSVARIARDMPAGVAKEAAELEPKHWFVRNVLTAPQPEPLHVHVAMEGEMTTIEAMWSLHVAEQEPSDTSSRAHIAFVWLESCEHNGLALQTSKAAVQSPIEVSPPPPWSPPVSSPLATSVLLAAKRTNCRRAGQGKGRWEVSTVSVPIGTARAARKHIQW